MTTQTPNAINSSPRQGHSLSTAQMMAYPLPVLATYFLMGPIAVLQGIYAKYFGLSLATIAAVIFIVRLFDAITDPIIGYCSDRYYARTGSRQPFIVSGALLFIFSSYFLYVPPENVSATYFLVWYLLFYLAFTLFEIPHLAWAGELALQAESRNNLYSMRLLGIYLGRLLFYAVPLLPFFGTTEFTPQSLKWSTLAAGVLMLPLLYICTKMVPNHCKVSSVSYKATNRKPQRLRSLLLAMLDNKPYLLYLTAFLWSGMGAGICFSLLFIFVDTYLGLGHRFAVISLLCICISTISIGMWGKLANLLGKKATLGLGMLLSAIAVTGMGWLTPGETTFFPLFLLMLLIYVGSTSVGSVGPSLLSDIIDYAILKSGRDDCAASYFSVHVSAAKADAAVGGALGFAIAGAYGFDPSATVHTEEAIFGLRLTIAWLPALFFLMAMVFIVLIPLNARRQAIIRRRLDARATRRESEYRKQQAEENMQMQAPEPESLSNAKGAIHAN